MQFLIKKRWKVKVCLKNYTSCKFTLKHSPPWEWGMRRLEIYLVLVLPLPRCESLHQGPALHPPPPSPVLLDFTGMLWKVMDWCNRKCSKSTMQVCVLGAGPGRSRREESFLPTRALHLRHPDVLGELSWIRQVALKRLNQHSKILQVASDRGNTEIKFKPRTPESPWVSISP